MEYSIPPVLLTDIWPNYQKQITSSLIFG